MAHKAEESRYLSQLINHGAIIRTVFGVIAQCKKPTRKWHIWFFPTHKPTLKKPKEPFFANAQTGQLDNYSNIFYLEKRDIKK
jgi:hypothetical protein